MRKFLDKYFKYISTIPSMIVVIIAAIIPLAYVIYTSFFQKNLMRGTNSFVGFGNYIDLFGSQSFWKYFSLTLKYTFYSVAIGFSISIGIAYLLDQKAKYKKISLSFILIPWMIPVIASAIMWKWLFHDVYGLINFIGLKIGILNAPVNWLGDTGIALGCLILVEIWYRNPFDILVLSSGMKRVPRELYEAAAVDGARARHIFTKIIIPEIRPDILLVLILRTTFALRESGLPFAFTRGGPGESTELLAVWIYKLSNLYLDYGTGATVSIFLLIISISITLLYNKILNRRKEQGLNA